MWQVGHDLVQVVVVADLQPDRGVARRPIVGLRADPGRPRVFDFDSSIGASDSRSPAGTDGCRRLAGESRPLSSASAGTGR